MSFDLVAHLPEGGRLREFGCSVWVWHPLWNELTSAGLLTPRQAAAGHFNDGATVGPLGALAIYAWLKKPKHRALVERAIVVELMRLQRMGLKFEGGVRAMAPAAREIVDDFVKFAGDSGGFEIW